MFPLFVGLLPSSNPESYIDGCLGVHLPSNIRSHVLGYADSGNANSNERIKRNKPELENSNEPRKKKKRRLDDSRTNYSPHRILSTLQSVAVIGLIATIALNHESQNPSEYPERLGSISSPQDTDRSNIPGGREQTIPGIERVHEGATASVGDVWTRTGC